MREVIRRIGHDLRHLRNIDAYAVAVVAFVFAAALSVAGDTLPDNPRWVVLLVGVGLLVYRITLPDHPGRGRGRSAEGPVLLRGQAVPGQAADGP